MQVYIHLHSGCVTAGLGNGGLLAMFELAHALDRMGYEVGLLGDQRLPDPSAWKWLSLPGFPFMQWTLDGVLGGGEYRVVSLHLTRLWAALGKRLRRPGETIRWARTHLRYWDNDNLLREGPEFDLERRLVEVLPGPLYVTNPHLAWAYANQGFQDIVALEPWIPPMFHPDNSIRIEGRAGYQLDNWGFGTLTKLELTDSLSCVGLRSVVAIKMRTCDLFVWLNGHKRMRDFGGEGFGMSMYEAMASGCAVLARRHAGNEHVRVVPLYDDPKNLKRDLHNLSETQKNEMRAEQFAWVQQKYRWNAGREAIVRQWLE